MRNLIRPTLESHQIAAIIKGNIDSAREFPSGEQYTTALADAAITFALAFKQADPEFNTDEFYTECGYPGPHPTH